MQYEETPIEDAIEIIQSITCPDEKSACPDGTTTCCPKLNGGYHCCAYPNGVCCKDSNCCPHGTQCAIERGCTSHFLPMLTGLPEINNIDPPLH